VSNPVKLSGTLPDDVRCGLYADKTVQEFLAQPRQAVLVVGLVTNVETRTNNVSGTVTPLLKFVHVEVVAPGHDHYGLASEILMQAHAARTGAMMLPFEPGQDVNLSATEESTGTEGDSWAG